MLNNLGREGTYLNIRKAIYEILATNIYEILRTNNIFKSERLKAFP